MSHQTTATGWTATPARRRHLTHADAIRIAKANGRREDYAWLRTDQGLTIEQAATRLRVSYRTAQRYEAAMHKAGVP